MSPRLNTVFKSVQITCCLLMFVSYSFAFYGFRTRVVTVRIVPLASVVDFEQPILLPMLPSKYLTQNGCSLQRTLRNALHDRNIGYFKAESLIHKSFDPKFLRSSLIQTNFRRAYSDDNPLNFTIRQGYLAIRGPANLVIPAVENNEAIKSIANIEWDN